MAEMCQIPLDLIPAADCPFCDEFESRLRETQISQLAKGKQKSSDTGVIVVPPSLFRRHVGSHLEQLALFAMGSPHPADDGSIASDAVAGDADSRRSVLSDRDSIEFFKSDDQEAGRSESSLMNYATDAC